MTALKKHQILTFTLCWIAYALIYFGRVNLSVALPAIETDLNFSKATLGLIGTIFFWIYGTGQLINGQLGDRFSSRFFVFTGLLVAAAANFLFGFTSSLAVMLLLWGINGYFQSMLWGPIVKTLSHWFSYEHRALIALGISTSMVGGFLLAWGFSGYLVAASGWRTAFLAPGIVLGGFGFIWLIFLREHPEDRGLLSPNLHGTARNSKKKGPALIPLLKRSRLGLVVIACFTQGIVKDGIGLWGPSFLLERWDLGLETTVKAILIIPFTNLGGMLLATRLNILLGNKEKRTILVLLALGAASLGGLVINRNASLIFGLAFLSLTSAFMYGANALLLGVIPMNFTSQGAVSTVAGFLDFCSYLAAGAASVLTGLTVEYLGWKAMLILWFVSAVIGTLAIAVDLKQKPPAAD